MNLLLTTTQAKILKESIETQNISRENFVKEVKLFLFNILSNNTNQLKSNFWKLNGLRNNDVLNKLIRFGVIEKQAEKPMIPKKNFERKVDRLYYDIFPEHEVIVEDGDGGANNCGSVGGSYEVPFMSPMRRKINSF